AEAGVAPGDEYVSLAGHALRKDFNLVLDILSDELRNPSFPADRLESARRRGLEGLEEGKTSTGDLPEIAFHQALYPADHPYWEPDLDTQEAALKAITRDDLMSFYK